MDTFGDLNDLPSLLAQLASNSPLLERGLLWCYLLTKALCSARFMHYFWFTAVSNLSRYEAPKLGLASA